MGKDIKKHTEKIIKDLHARELMRLGWYRMVAVGGEKIRQLRERKATHQAFLNELLRRRGLSPAWYARFFYLTGNLLGLLTSFLPSKLATKIQNILEWWMLLRYEEYFKQLKLSQSIRSMVEALQLSKLHHNEPDSDVMNLLETYISDEKKIISQQ